MNKRFKNIIVGFILILRFMPSSYSQNKEEFKDISRIDTLKKDTYWRSLIRGNEDRTFEKKIDLSFIVTPSYAREPSFGLGGAATGLYRLDRNDSLIPPSNITVIFNASINGFFSLSAIGNNIFKGNHSRLFYQVAFFNKNLDFWGISFDDADVNSVIGYRRQTLKIYAYYQYELKKKFYIGGILDFLLTNAIKIDDESYLLGQNKIYATTGLGSSVQYDSRDFIPNPKCGIYLLLGQTVYPQNYGSAKHTLFRNTFTFNFYQKLWSGAILAIDLYGQVSTNNLPWTLREELGSTNRMRGYYKGRYIDNNIVSGQMELRHHLIWRIGYVVWVGGGTVFPSIQEFDIKNILPNYGLGMRFEIKHNVNARIDFGFGKQTMGFVFGINEAF